MAPDFTGAHDLWSCHLINLPVKRTTIPFSSADTLIDFQSNSQALKRTNTLIGCMVIHPCGTERLVVYLWHTKGDNFKTMVTKEPSSATDFLPAKRTLEALRDAAHSCKGCDLYKNATQTVFGEGPQKARVVLVGEQPGDQEDRQGHPFVGPAGRLLDKALADARIPREQVYVTNAVKHFKWIWRGKRRLHQKPAIRQVTACKPWLEAEFEAVRPKIVVCMGATAAQSVFGKSVPITKERGKFIDLGSGLVSFITIHPSAIYRHQEREEQDKEYRRFAAEMKLVHRKLQSMGAN
jgi:DNA polymerase